MALPRFLAALALCLVVGAASAQPREVQDINQQFRKGDLAGALARANAYLNKNPKDAQVRFLKGLILADQGKTNDAIAIFTGLTEDFPELPEPYNNLAVLYASQGKYDDAKRALEQAIRTHPSYATAHENLGDIFAKMAAIAYDKALALDNRNVEAQTKLSLIKEITGGQPRRPAARPAAVASKPAAPAAVRPAATAPAAAATARAPAAAAAPATATAASAEAPDRASIEAAVNAWAQAWSRRDVDAYLAAYAPDFSAGGLSRAAWEAQRRQRIEPRKTISVEVSRLRIEQQGDSATATFRQAYRSDTLNSTVTKVLKFVRLDGQWRIVSETTR